MDHAQIYIFPGLLLPALRHCWRKAVVFALILAVLFAAGGLLWGGLRMADADARRTEKESYDLALDRYNAQREALEIQIDALTVSIRKQQDYLSQSVLMALDPYNFYEGRVSVQLHTDYQILPGMTYQDPDPSNALRTAYTESLESPELLQAMAAAVNGDVRYMAELLVIQKTDSGLTVDVRYADAQGARLLLEQVVAHLRAAHTAINANVAEHTVTVTNQGVAHRLDPSLAAAQQAKGDKLTETVKTLTTVKTRQTDLVKPTLELNSWSAVGRRIVLLVLLGGLLGGCGYLAAALWLYEAGSRLVAPAQLEQLEIPSLGLYAPEYTKLDLAARLPVEGTVLLTGSRPSAQLEQLARELAQTGRKVVCVTDIIKDVRGLQALQECDIVVLVQPRFDTVCTELLEQKKRMVDYGKPLFGCVITTD